MAARINDDYLMHRIDFYRTMHQTHSYSLETTKVPAEGTFNELTLAAQFWCSLAAEGTLGRLVLDDRVHAAKELLEQGNGSSAELLLTFIQRHKAENGIEAWDVTSMCEMR